MLELDETSDFRKMVGGWQTDKKGTGEGSSGGKAQTQGSHCETQSSEAGEWFIHSCI